MSLLADTHGSSKDEAVPRHVRRQLERAVEKKEIKPEAARQIMRMIQDSCFSSRMQKNDPKKAARLAQRYQDDADWMRKMGFDITVGHTLNLDQYFRLIEPRNFVKHSTSTTHYQLGNQATYSVEMGPINFAFQGAIVWMIVGNRVTTTTNDEGTFRTCAPTFNFLRAASGWASETTINSVALEDSPVAGSFPVYNQTWLKGYLTRQAVQTHVAQEPDSCQDYTANYVYRYQYHAPDGRVIAFYQRPEEVPQTSTWGPNANFCNGRQPIIPREPDFYWSVDGNASLDTSNKCRPLIRWSDGSTEEFNMAMTQDTPIAMTDPTKPETMIAEPYFPACSAGDFARDLRIIDRNGNVVTFSSEGMIDAQGRKTMVHSEEAGAGFQRLRVVELPSIGNASPLRYTIEWKTIQVDFAQIWPDVKCHEDSEGLVKPCSNATNPQDFSMPGPDILDVVDFIATPDGRRYTFEYGPWGNLTRVTEPSGSVREWIYGDETNLGYARAVTPLLNRLEQGQCLSLQTLGYLWTDETFKMQARGVTEERVYPNGLPAAGLPLSPCSATSGDRCFYPTTHDFALRKLPHSYCDFDPIGASSNLCSQVWKTSVLPDGTITKAGSNVATLAASWWDDDQHVALTVDLHGMPLAQETYSGNELVAATYSGDPATGAIWTDGDVVPIRGSPYAMFANTRPTRTVSIRDGLATTTNFFYGNWIDIDPASTRTIKRHTTNPTSTCTFAGIVPVQSDRANDGCTLSAPGDPLIRAETSYINYFDPVTLNSRVLLDLTKETRSFGPNHAKTGFSTIPLTEQISEYDQFEVAPSGRPDTALDRSIGSNAGAPRGNATTQRQRVDGTRTITFETRFYDEGSIRSVKDPRGFVTRHEADFARCTSVAALTERQINHLGHITTTVLDCQSGLPLRVTDPNGRSTYTQYDHLGRVVETAGVGDELTALPTSGGQAFTRDSAAGTPTGSGGNPGDARVTTWTEYLDLGDPKRQRVVSHLRDGSPGGAYTKVFTDGLGRVVQTRAEVDPAKTGGYSEVVASSDYDGRDRVVAAYVPCFAQASNSVTAHCNPLATKTTYDAIGRELSVRKPGDRLTSYEYDAENGRWRTIGTSPRNFTTRTYTNLLGHVVQIDRQSSLCPGGFCSSKMTYDPLGRTLSESDAGGNTIDYTYDMLGRRATMSDPDMGKSLGKQWKYEYDEMGNLSAQIDAKGQRIEFKFDPINRITLKDMPPIGMSADDVTYFYDGQGPVPTDNPAPSLTSMSPTAANAGSAGFALTIHGANFTVGSVVRFNGQDRATTFVSSSQLSAVILTSDMQASGAYPVTVFTSAPGGGTSAALTFSVGGTTPSISSISPQSANAGSAPFTLTVNGSNFVSGAVVTFNGQSRQTTFVTAQRVTAAIPASDVQTAGTFSVRVVHPGGASSGPAQFTVSGPPPTITLSAPKNGQSFTRPVSINLSATASVAVGNVQFFKGSTLLGTDSAAPFSFDWTNPEAGTFVLTAKLTTSNGSVATSNTATITINDPPSGGDNAQAAFSATLNPAGNWSYGFRTGAGPFTAYAVKTTPYGTGANVWRADADCCPLISNNNTAANYTYANAPSIIHAPDVLNLHPGPADRRSVLRWTAPATGTYRIAGRFQGLDQVGTSTDAVIHHNGSTLFSTPVNGYGTTIPFAITRAVLTGDVIELSVSDGANNTYSNDSTGVAVTITAAAAGSNAVQDFSSSVNPNTPWTYGMRANDQAFAAYTVAATPYGAGTNVWRSGADCCPLVGKNNTGSTYTYANAPSIVHPADVLNLHPGPSGQRSVLRWTAGSSGTYRISGRFEGIDTVGTTTDAAIHLNGETLFSRDVNGYGTKVPFDLVRALAAGQSIEVSVGDGNNDTYLNDSTGVALTIAPAAASDAVAQFSKTLNPSGPWTYGSLAAGGTFGAHGIPSTFFGGGADAWMKSTSTCCPMVAGNNTGTAYTYPSAPSIVHPAGVLNLHPGPSGERSAIRWTAPATGTYRIEGKFEGLDTVGTTTHVTITHNATVIWSSDVNGYGTQVPFSLSRVVTVGDRIDFSVGAGANAVYTYDSTGLVARIIDESASPQ
ncbi:MAG TPA: Ig-like domain-containing protein [Thermoanaerobaculia bacterium]|nr:Ig-like domain-containing protein [Thermoanaerobaculia bacterium]